MHKMIDKFLINVIYAGSVLCFIRFWVLGLSIKFSFTFFLLKMFKQQKYNNSAFGRFLHFLEEVAYTIFHHKILFEDSVMSCVYALVSILISDFYTLIFY